MAKYEAKVTIGGKDYIYEYQAVQIKKPTHIRLKTLARQNMKPLSDMIEKLLDYYETEERIKEIINEKNNI